MNSNTPRQGDGSCIIDTQRAGGTMDTGRLALDGVIEECEHESESIAPSAAALATASKLASMRPSLEPTPPRKAANVLNAACAPAESVESWRTKQ